MIKTSKPTIEYDKILEVIAVLKAIEISYQSGTEVFLEDLI